jgi:tRNA 2-thiouridine synthesizing protein B
MILHTLNQPPANAACFERCREAMSSDDTLLLIEDGVYWALPAFAARLESLSGRVKVLAADAAARGVDLPAAHCIDDQAFVALCVSHDKVVSWF